MERHSLLRSMIRKWWIFLVVLLITVGATFYLTMQQTPIYRAKATYINRLNSEITDTKTVSTALDTLNRYDNLQGTYSEIAMSQLIKRQAGSKMGLSNADLRNLTVSSRTLPGSRILEITVEGEDLQLVRDFTKTVGEETITYVNNLYPSYAMVVLDEPTAVSKPVSPKLTFNLVLGVILGALLGFAALWLSSWLRGDLKNAPVIQSTQEEPGDLQPVRKELELLLQQCELIRVELNETREVIQNTESQAQTVRTMLDTLSKNGHSG